MGLSGKSEFKLVPVALWGRRYHRPTNPRHHEPVPDSAPTADRRAAARIFEHLQAEWQRTEQALSLITGQSRRLQAAPALARSIESRFPYLDPLNHLQVELLRRYRARREGDPEVARVRTGIHLSINGLATGLRNTG